MEFIRISQDNLESEHICCAISSNRDVQVMSKKAWLRDRLDEGLVFLKGNVRGKCFIEYIPAEYAWVPVRADGYMYIDCLWVSGQFKGNGYSGLLLDECIRDSRAKGCRGLVTLSSPKKLGFLADKKYLEHKGFCTADTVAPYFELMYLPFDGNTQPPRFCDSVKQVTHDMPSGFAIYYTAQCPFTAKYVPLLETVARAHGVPLSVVRITSREAAQGAPSPFTTFSLFYDGRFLTHEILSEKKFEKIIADIACK